MTFAFTPAFAQFEAPDPSRTVPSGRVLAVGRAFTGLSEGTAAIYCNPAGLANAESWQVASMSGKFLDEYSYLSFSGLYPTPVGNFGLGFMGSSISGAYSTMKDPNSSDEDPVYIIDPSQPPISYFNNVSILTYGSGLDRFLKRFGWEDKVSLGANLKLFQSGLSGDGITQGTASGVELDLGVLYATPWRFLSLGATLQNALPSSMGGRLRYETGHEEAYPAQVELGAALNVIGKKDAIRQIGEHQVLLLLDYDFHPTLAGLPPTLHCGAEYKPVPMIAMRVGLDQDISGNGLGTGVGTVGNLTGGVGFSLGGFSFDYAYRSFAGVSQISNNYISLSYSPPAPLPVKKASEPIELIRPPDKLITFDAAVSVEGKVVDDKIRYVTIGDLAAKVSLRGDFSRSEELKIGKNALNITGFSRERKQLYATQLRALRLTVFPDVPAGYWVAQPVSLLAMANVITGYPDGTFRPEGNITRAEMCSLLMKSRGTTEGSSIVDRRSSIVFKDVPAKHWAAPYIEEAAAQGLVKGYPGKSQTVEEPKGFTDVPSQHWAAQYITQAADFGVVKGYPGNLFKPNGKITRAEGLAMVARFAGVSEEAAGAIEFRDVPADFWGASLIAGSARAGLLDFLKGKLFEQNKLLTRAETVEMLRQTAVVKGILGKDLLDWDSY